MTQVTTKAGAALLDWFGGPMRDENSLVEHIAAIEAEVRAELAAQVRALPDDPLAYCPECTAPEHADPPRNRKCIDHAAVLDLLEADSVTPEAPVGPSAVILTEDERLELLNDNPPEASVGERRIVALNTPSADRAAIRDAFRQIARAERGRVLADEFTGILDAALAATPAASDGRSRLRLAIDAAIDNIAHNRVAAAVAGLRAARKLDDERPPASDGSLDVAVFRYEGLNLDELHAAIATADWFDPNWLDKARAKKAARSSDVQDTTEAKDG